MPTLFARRPPQPPALSNWTRLRKPQHFQLASEILLSSKVTFSPVRIGWCIYCYLCLVEFFKILHSLTPLCQNGYSESLHRHQRSSRQQRNKPTKSRVSMHNPRSAHLAQHVPRSPDVTPVFPAMTEEKHRLPALLIPLDFTWTFYRSDI